MMGLNINNYENPGVKSIYPGVFVARLLKATRRRNTGGRISVRKCDGAKLRMNTGGSLQMRWGKN